MNKYVLRTSLVWITVLAAIAGLWAYRSHGIKVPTAMKTPMSGDMQPVASGPPATADEPKPSMPDMKMDAPVVPVQLTPERMQSIGVRTGTVEYKQLSDDIRATGTVDINERLISYVQVRFPAISAKSLQMLPISMCARVNLSSRSTALILWRHSRSTCWHGRTKRP